MLRESKKSAVIFSQNAEAILKNEIGKNLITFHNQKLHLSHKYFLMNDKLL